MQYGIICILTILSASLLHHNALHTEASPEKFTVMAYNVMQLNLVQWDQAQRAAKFGESIRTLQNIPDVILLQEVMNQDIEHAIYSLKDIYPHQTLVLSKNCTADKNYFTSLSGICERPNSIFSSGVIAISRHPITAKHGIYFKDYDQGTADFIINKGAILIRVEVDKNEKYNLVSTHLQSSAGKVTNTSELIQHNVRMKQLGAIKKLIDDLKIPKTEPVIIAGDLNIPLIPGTDESKNAAIEEMQKISSATVMKIDKETEAARKSIGTYSCPTNWLVKYFLKNLGYGAKSVCNEQILDYIMVRNEYLQEVAPSNGYEIILLKSKKPTIWEQLKGEYPFAVNGASKFHNGEYSDISDHYPIVKTFYFYSRKTSSSIAFGVSKITLVLVSAIFLQVNIRP